MNHSTTLTASLLTACLASPILAQTTPITLNYNFNGIIHAGEAGLPDDPAGFRSISDRALDFSAGIPVDPLLANYQLVATPGAFDIVHLGNRNTVDNGNWLFDATPDGDTIGVQPAWLTNADQSTPQVSVITPTVVFANTTARFIYQISNGGGSFDVTFTFAGGATYTASMSGPDWFTGAYLGTQDVDLAAPGVNLSITEALIDLGAFAGDVVTEITFSNRSNPVAGYAILGCTFDNSAKHTAVGSGCYPINELASWHQEFLTAAAAEAVLDNQGLLLLPNGNGAYTTIVAGGVFRPGNPASLVTLGDDAQTPLTLPAPFNFRGTTPVATVYLSSNGFLSMGPGNGSRDAEQPVFFSTATEAAIVAYGEDLDPDNGLAGVISTEYDAASDTYYITFEDVPHYPGNAAIDGAATFQYQLGLASGICTIVYGDMTPGTNVQLDNVCIGETVPAAATNNPIDLFAVSTFSTYAADNVAVGVVLSADVPAVSTPTSGTVVTYSVANAPDFAPTALPGVKVGVLIGSPLPLAPLPGVDLGFLNAPGCALFVSSLDFVVGFDLAGSVALAFPAGLIPQSTLYFQAAMLIDPNDPAYPGSAAGVAGNTFTQTSNALVTTVSDS
jgi:hypothetical protein